jgi:hypothetical protein
MQCVGAVGTACQAATVVAGPWIITRYRRLMDAIGFADMSVAAVEERRRRAAAEAREPRVIRRPGRAAPLLQRMTPPRDDVPYWQRPVPPRRRRTVVRAPAESHPRVAAHRRLVTQLRVAAATAALRT